jgi:glycosyltransferase involved in cell wall biosynthesis
LRIAIAVPCYNEAPTVGKVVHDFKRELPEADIVVFDNASTDGTGDVAQAAGARVVREKRRGKGYVMQSIFELVDADVLVIVDGDDTYLAEDVHTLLEPVVSDRADMVVGNRLKDASGRALNDLRRFGNHLIIGIMNFVFRTSFQDVLSGYRVMNRNFLQSVPLITGGFETETELTLQALSKGMVIEELPIRYRERPSGSFSKLSPFGDGYRILITIAMLLRNHRPLYFFSMFSVMLAVAAVGYASAWGFGLLEAVPGYVNVVVVVGLVLLAFTLVIVGVMMNAINTGFRELQVLRRRVH